MTLLGEKFPEHWNLWKSEGKKRWKEKNKLFSLAGENIPEETETSEPFF